MFYDEKKAFENKKIKNIQADLNVIVLPKTRKLNII